MTREEARKAAEVMIAYADGKEIEFKMGNAWLPMTKPIFNWTDNKYRIKQEPTYRPFKNKLECLRELENHPNQGYVVYQGDICSVTKITNSYVYLGSLCLSFQSAHTYIEFTDNTPFGILV